MINLSTFAIHLAGIMSIKYLFPKVFQRSDIIWYISLLFLFAHAFLALPDVISLISEELHFYMHRYQRLQRTWYCGSGTVNSHIAGMWASLFAGKSLHDINECCYTHDIQYDQCIERESPDIEFRQCLVNACGNENEHCSYFVGEIFASTVETFGFLAYTSECGIDWMFNQQK